MKVRQPCHGKLKKTEVETDELGHGAHVAVSHMFFYVIIILAVESPIKVMEKCVTSSNAARYKILSISQYASDICWWLCVSESQNAKRLNCEMDLDLAVVVK